MSILVHDPKENIDRKAIKIVIPFFTFYFLEVRSIVISWLLRWMPFAVVCCGSKECNWPTFFICKEPRAAAHTYITVL